MRSAKSWGLRVLLLAAPGLSWAQAPGLAPIVPLARGNGFSTIEQRYVYAPPDKGSFTVPLSLALGAQKEVILEEPVMCGADASASVDVSYDKAKNRVKFKAHFKKSLPYRMSYTRPNDISTPYNQFPVSVTEGHWQLWLVANLNSVQSIFYYDAATLQLIGNENDLPGPPPNSIPVSLPVTHMLCSPEFEGKPNGDGELEFDERYDHMLDLVGQGGTFVTYLPYNLCKPDEYGAYYTNPLPATKGPSWDSVLDSIWNGYGFAISSSLEPVTKPEYLKSRDNLMIGWTGTYPLSIPKGLAVNPLNGLIYRKTTCGTHINPAFPTALYNLCGG